MKINRYSLGHAIRTICAGLFVIGLVPLLFFFMGPGSTEVFNNYLIYMGISFTGIVIGQVLLIVNKDQKDLSFDKRKREKIYGIVGISIIALFSLMILYFAFLQL